MANHVVSGFSELDQRAVAAARAIPLHLVQQKGHGHAGTAMALAPIAHVLFSRVLRHSPANPQWRGRDRFVLSAGHASLLLYVQQYLSGYGLCLDDLAHARGFGSLTPGHPELHGTPGVEMSTGPLGQGVASAVGMAMAARHERALLDPDGSSGLFDQTVWVIAGDGCLQEGVSAEACSLAGTLGLDNLVVIWDDNRVTIDGPTSDAFAEDVRARYRAYGWRVLEIGDPNDLEKVAAVLGAARAEHAPVLIATQTEIGWPSPALRGTSAAHAGPFGAADVAATKLELGFASDAPLADLVPPDVLAHTRQALARGAQLEQEWNERAARWSASANGRAEVWRDLTDPTTRTSRWHLALDRIGADLPAEGGSVATRSTNGAVLAALHATTGLWGGSADLSGSTTVDIPGVAFSATAPQGEFIRFGIREHAMTAILSGIALHGAWRPYGSTYLVFSDYLRPALRLAALMKLPTILVFTHDSIWVGEDGPTHQPIEQIAGLRTVPGVDVVRPADAHEVVAAWHRIADTTDRPTALVLSRQGLPALPARPGLRESVAAGGYVVWQHGDGLDLALIAAGSEVSVALDVARELASQDVSVRVVSMPCTEWFDEQDESYRDFVLPGSMTARVAVEAGVGSGWWKYVGLAGRVVSIEDFGISGSGSEVAAALGLTHETILTAARNVLDAAPMHSPAPAVYGML
ncbi:MAG: transketolase family protein [Cellulomonas sp.]